MDPLKDKEVDSREAIHKEIECDLLPKLNKAALAREPNYKPTHLLCVTLWLKPSRMFLNQGTQKEACTLFIICEKQLRKVITGRKYFGSTNRKRSADNDKTGRSSRLRRKKSQPAEMVVKEP